jgi:hypothetical protein
VDRFAFLVALAVLDQLGADAGEDVLDFPRSLLALVVLAELAAY